MRSDAVVAAERVGDRTRCTTLRSAPPISLRDTPDGLYLVASGAGPVGGDELSVSVSVGLSIGLVLVDRPGIDAEALVSQADGAMYRAKRNGGGRTEVVDDRRGPDPRRAAAAVPAADR